MHNSSVYRQRFHKLRDRYTLIQTVLRNRLKSLSSNIKWAGYIINLLNPQILHNPAGRVQIHFQRLHLPLVVVVHLGQLALLLRSIRHDAQTGIHGDGFGRRGESLAEPRQEAVLEGVASSVRATCEDYEEKQEIYLSSKSYFYLKSSFCARKRLKMLDFLFHIKNIGSGLSLYFIQ